MDVRRFEATTMKEALSSVKKELGANAVILSTKQRSDRESGVSIYEITAATPSTTKVGAQAFDRFDQTNQPSADSVSGREVLQRINELSEDLVTRSQFRILESAISDLKMLVIEGLRNSSTQAVPEHLFSVDRQLKAAGLDVTVQTDVVRHLRSLPLPTELEQTGIPSVEDYYKDQAVRWMIKRIKIAPKWTTTPGMTNVHFIIGGGGAGKSSMALKLASAIKRKEKHKAVLISFDPLGLGSSEKMRLHAKALNMTHLVISSAEELKKCTKENRHSDLLLVDTPAINSTVIDTVKELQKMKDSEMGVEFHLILSSSEKSNFNEQIIKRSSPIGISSVSFSKLDDTNSYGDVFSTSNRWSLPIAYLVDSSDMTSGIEKATRERILERLFNI
jgi:flagellar biosynthesis protein FlhF